MHVTLAQGLLKSPSPVAPQVCLVYTHTHPHLILRTSLISHMQKRKKCSGSHPEFPMKSLNTFWLHVHVEQMLPCWWFEGMLGYKPFLVRTVLSTERRNSHFLFAPMSQVQHSSCIRGAASPASAGQPFSPSREPGFQVPNFIRPLPPFSV